MALKQAASSSKKRGGHKNYLASPYQPSLDAARAPPADEVCEAIKARLLADLEPLRLQPRKRGKGATSERHPLRQRLAIGINEVARGLERDAVCGVVMCSTTHPILTQHLITLAGLRGAVLVALPQLSETLHDVVRTRCVTALGLLKPPCPGADGAPTPASAADDVIQGLLDLLRSHGCNSPQLPWIVGQGAGQKQDTVLPDDGAAAREIRYLKETMVHLTAGSTKKPKPKP